ncbi:Rh155 [macacine betaherpesvirus 3]|uniref:ORF UL121 n=1 Tax=Macaca mulatta cytomegalovirus TaxID=10373 RepID=Q90144_9BETA|nr:ORF UL121 [Macaca mulatta cytomegalovirus]QQL11516.1 Rh155 [macacine betaherpesvirus 3]
MMLGLAIVLLTNVVVSVCGVQTPDMCWDRNHIKVKCLLRQLDTRLYWFMNDTKRVWAFDYDSQTPLSVPYRVEVRGSLWSSESAVILRMPPYPMTTVGLLLKIDEGREGVLCVGVVPKKRYLNPCGWDSDLSLWYCVCVLLTVGVMIAGILKLDYDTTRHLTDYKSWLSRRTRYFEPAVKRW